MQKKQALDVEGLDIDEVVGEPPACALCIHWIEGKRLCMAFKESPIPDEIWRNGNPHTEPFPGDGGILFEAIAD